MQFSNLSSLQDLSYLRTNVRIQTSLQPINIDRSISNLALNSLRQLDSLSRINLSRTAITQNHLDNLRPLTELVHLTFLQTALQPIHLRQPDTNAP